jgi:YVTN family beta-propeller protein
MDLADRVRLAQWDVRPLLNIVIIPIGLVCACAADYTAPAGMRPAMRRAGAESVLPGGRLISPTGRQFRAGAGTFGIAVSADGSTVATSDGGPDRFSITIVDPGKPQFRVRQFYAWHKRDRNAPPPAARRPEAQRGIAADADDDPEYLSNFMGLAFAGEHTLYAAEGNSGRVRAIDTRTGKRTGLYDFNRGGFADSYTSEIALDPDRGILYVLDQANFRLAALDLARNRVLSSVKLGRLPFAMALTPDRKRAWITNLGLLEYKAIPGADVKHARETGIAFPAFGFPSPEARTGARRTTEQGRVTVPGVGDPMAPEAMSVAVVSLENPEALRLEKLIPTGTLPGGTASGGSSPSGVVATADRVYVSNAHNDSVSVINPATLEVERDIPIRVPGLEGLRGVMPLGLAVYQDWLLVAEAGLNAVGVIDCRAGRPIGHIPVGWFPTRLAVDSGTVWVANAKGNGTGPNADPVTRKQLSELRHGSISMFPVPAASDLAAMTRTVFKNAVRTMKEPPPAIPAGLRYVVIILKENRTFDEVLGDMTAANGTVAGDPELARFGERAAAPSERGALTQRFSLRNVNVTPNHHALARRWAFSDNFYADSEVSVDGHHWAVGSYPNAWTESSLMAAYGGQKDFRLPASAPGRLQYAQSNSSVHPEEYLEAGTLWHHLERHGISFRNFGEGFELAGVDEGEGLKPTGARYLTNVPMPDPLYRNTSRDYPQFNMNIPDQYRASRFIKEIEERYRVPGRDLPQLIFIHLPNDHMASPRPADGYPFRASYVADNDVALGRIMEYLSNSVWWRRMTVLITEDDAQGGIDHVDSHRTVLLMAGPYVRRNYVTHSNSSFPGMLKTVFRILGLPPLNLFDATAADLSDCFTGDPDFTPYKALGVNRELFRPEEAREPLDPKPSPRMDDPRETSKQREQE